MVSLTWWIARGFKSFLVIETPCLMVLLLLYYYWVRVSGFSMLLLLPYCLLKSMVLVCCLLESLGFEVAK